MTLDSYYSNQSQNCTIKMEIAIYSEYANCAIAPTLLDTQEACDREPLLNPQGISGALSLPLAHINLDSFVTAHSQAFQKIGGEIIPLLSPQRFLDL